MNKQSPWTLLRKDNEEQHEGLTLIQEAHAHYRSGSTIMELGIAHLWLRQYQQAEVHFQEAISSFPQAGDAFYGMAGAANWCLGQPKEAVLKWHRGLVAKYNRASGLGVRMPLLLYFASRADPGLVDEKVVKQLLIEKTTDPRIVNWPGPIAQILLDQIKEDDLRSQLRSCCIEDMQNREWLAKFYKNLAKCNKNERSALSVAMGELNERDLDLATENVFLARIWNEEFFLARFEAEALN